MAGAIEARVNHKDKRTGAPERRPRGRKGGEKIITGYRAREKEWANEPYRRHRRRFNLDVVFYLEAARAEVVDRVVAVVSNDVITLYELDNVVKSYIERMGKSLGSEDRNRVVEETRKVVLNRMIDD